MKCCKDTKKAARKIAGKTQKAEKRKARGGINIKMARERLEEGMEKKLSEFKAGESGEVKKIDGEGQIRRRIFDMGVTPGAHIRLRKVAPLGDPVEVTVRGYELTLRKSEAACVVMEVSGKKPKEQ